MTNQQVMPYDFPDSCPPSSEPTPEPTPEPSGVTLTAEALAAETGADQDRAERILAVATATVIEYAPHAPTALLNESVIRFAGYLVQSDYGTVREESVGQVSRSLVVNHATMFRNSGAQSLVTGFKVRRAGRV